MRNMAIASALLVAAIVARPAPAATDLAAPLSGNARQAIVFDGDSLDFSGLHIQLAGIDAPELGQICGPERDEKARCGLTAAYELRKRLQLDPRPLRCWPQGKPANGTVIATCAAGEEDLALVLLESGYAWALPDAQIDYRLAEEKAREARLGLWSADSEKPAEWRAGIAKSGGARTPAEGCVIAGVVVDGRKLYFGPLDPDYGKRTAGPGAVERWFCTEEEARDAGWRRPAEKAPA